MQGSVSGMSAVVHNLRVVMGCALLAWTLSAVAETTTLSTRESNRCAEAMLTRPEDPPSPLTGPHFPADEAETTRLILRLLRERYPTARQIGKLGFGAESVAYLVAFNRSHSIVIKVPRRLQDARVHAAFARERHILRAVRVADTEAGAHLVEFYGLVRWRELDMPVLILGNATQGTLENMLSHFGPSMSRADPHRFVRAWTQMALALRGLHAIGVVHRDIKPANFLVTMRRGALHLLLNDLGLSTLRGAMPPGLEGLMSGTLTHMSANQLARGAAEPPDDIHGLYMTFREMLMGQTIWQVNPALPENNVALLPIDYFGTYPILTGLPDSVARTAHPDLVAFLAQPVDRVEQVLLALKKLAGQLK